MKGGEWDTVGNLSGAAEEPRILRLLCFAFVVRVPHSPGVVFCGNQKQIFICGFVQVLSSEPFR